MKQIRSSTLASAAIAALLAMPVAALAQTQPQPPLRHNYTGEPPLSSTLQNAPPPAEAPVPETAHPQALRQAEQRVDQHIKNLHAALKITPSEEPAWHQFAGVMRANARDMDNIFMRRAQDIPHMNAVQSLQSYEELAMAHAKHLQQLVPAFEKVYNEMPAQQKQLADHVFYQRGAQHHEKRMQTGHAG